jgi:hypothetical protein
VVPGRLILPRRRIQTPSSGRVAGADAEIGGEQDRVGGVAEVELVDQPGALVAGHDITQIL